MKPLKKFAPLVAAMALVGGLSTAAHATPVDITGSFSIDENVTVNGATTTTTAVRPYNTASPEVRTTWSAITNGTTFGGIYFGTTTGGTQFTVGAIGGASSGSQYGVISTPNAVVSTFGISNPVQLNEIIFDTAGTFVLGQGTDLSGSGGTDYSAYTLRFSYDANAASSIAKGLTGASFLLTGRLSFDTNTTYGEVTDAFNETAYQAIFNCSGCVGNGSNGDWVISFSASPVPLPGSLALLGLGLIGAVGVARRTQRVLA